MRVSGITDQRMLWGVVAGEGEDLVHLRIVGGMRWPDQHAIALLARDEARAIGEALLEAAGPGKAQVITIETDDPDRFVFGLAEIASRSGGGHFVPHDQAPPELYDQELPPGHEMSGLIDPAEPPLGVTCSHPEFEMVDGIAHCTSCGRALPGANEP